MNEQSGYGLMVDESGWWVTMSTWTDRDAEHFLSGRVAMFAKRSEAIAFGINVFGVDTQSPERSV